MRRTAALLAVLTVSVAAQGVQPEGCPVLPTGAQNLGGVVPAKPENIPQGCKDFEILFARGTSEPDFADGGAFGVVVGDPIFSNLTKVLPNVQGYPVQYPASGANNSAVTGGNDVVARLKSQSKACPNQRFALVGYSQGAGVIRLAAAQLDVDIQEKIVAFVGVGDGARRRGRELLLPDILARRQLQRCYGTGTPDSDPVCDGNGKGCFYNHLGYIQPAEMQKTVDFLVERFNCATNPSTPSTGSSSGGNSTSPTRPVPSQYTPTKSAPAQFTGAATKPVAGSAAVALVALFGLLL